MYDIKVPATPKTTFSASVIGGGTSVNAIPNSVWLEVDMRSASAAELAKLEQQFLAIVPRTIAEENSVRSTRAGTVSADIKPIKLPAEPARTALEIAIEFKKKNVAEYLKSVKDR